MSLLFVDLFEINFARDAGILYELSAAVSDWDHCSVWDWIVVAGWVMQVHKPYQSVNLAVWHFHLKSVAALLSVLAAKLEIGSLETVLVHLDLADKTILEQVLGESGGGLLCVDGQVGQRKSSTVVLWSVHER